jgi:hypothetical protein
VEASRTRAEKEKPPVVDLNALEKQIEAARSAIITTWRACWATNSL